MRLVQLTSALAALLLSGCGQTHDPGGDIDSREARLVPAQAASVFEDYVRDARKSETFCPSWVQPIDSVALAQMEPTRAASEKTSFSTTNLQVAGVDEADRVKFNGRDLFIVDSNAPLFHHFQWSPQIRAGLFMSPLDTSAPNVAETQVHDVRVMSVNEEQTSATEVARIAVPQASAGIHGLYLLPPDGLASLPLLAVLGSNRDEPERDSWNRHAHSTLDIFDVAHPEFPAHHASLEIDGHMVTSRSVDGRLILVTRFQSHPARHTGCPLVVIEQRLVDDPDSEDVDDLDDPQLLPMVSVNGNAPEPLVDTDNCFVPTSILDSEIRTSVITTITSVDPHDLNDRLSMCIVGAASTVYSTSESLYLTQPMHQRIVDNASDWTIDGQQIGERVFKIAYEDSGPTYRGSAFVEGRIPFNIGSFAMGEHEGVFGIMTTGQRTVHQLTLLRERTEEVQGPSSEPTLEIVSRLPNKEQPAPIGKPGESIHAIRFMGPRVYAVTFKSIDPLYIIDISDAENPYIAGEVEIPGFSDYLHPIGENLLLGIGKDAFDMGSFAWYQGIKLELFDVSIPETLSSIDSVLIGMRGSQSSAISEHHAVTHLPVGDGHHRFTVPVQVHKGPESEPYTFHPWFETGLFLFEVEENSNPLESTIELVGAIVTDSVEMAVPDEIQRRSTIGDRSILLGDSVHYIVGEDVWSASWSEPADAAGPQ